MRIGAAPGGRQPRDLPPGAARATGPIRPNDGSDPRERLVRSGGPCYDVPFHAADRKPPENEAVTTTVRRQAAGLLASLLLAGACGGEEAPGETVVTFPGSAVGAEARE